MGRRGTSLQLHAIFERKRDGHDVTATHKPSVVATRASSEHKPSSSASCVHLLAQLLHLRSFLSPVIATTLRLPYYKSPPRRRVPSLTSSSDVAIMSKMADQQREPLVAGHPALVADAPAADRDGGFSWLTMLGFAFLTFNSAMAIYRSDGDKYAIAFVGFSYIDLVLLFICLRLFEKAEPNSSTRSNLKAAVWVLTTLLTVVFSYKVAAIMPVPVQVLVWAMAGATVLGGFYAFFVHRESKEG